MGREGGKGGGGGSGRGEAGRRAEQHFLSNPTKHYLMDLTGYFDFRFSSLVAGQIQLKGAGIPLTSNSLLSAELKLHFNTPSYYDVNGESKEEGV